ncbi:hypothetical protein M758_8G112000 [Ceratodon purpureus]|nr:hypothetical protein M758_8G112000 [Ceratodon purpureus]
MLPPLGFRVSSLLCSIRPTGGVDFSTAAILEAVLELRGRTLVTIRGLSFAGCIAGRLGRLLGFRLPFAAGAAGLEVGEAGALLPDYFLVGQGLRFIRTGSVLSFDVILGFCTGD